MNYLHIPKAQIAYKDNIPAPDLTIFIKREVPKFKELGEQDAYFDIRASELEDALYNTLPGGLYDRLLGEMLARKATHFRVSHNA